MDSPFVPPAVVIQDGLTAPIGEDAAEAVWTKVEADLPKLKQKQKVRFDGRGDEFHRVLNQRVDAYFIEKGILKHANLFMAFKTAFWISALVVVYTIFLTAGFSFPQQLVAAAALGFCLATIGFNIGHDALHGAFSKNQTINRIFGWGFTVMGAATLTWVSGHNVRHHSYTNIPGHDTDLEPGPFLRFHDVHPMRWGFRFQHLYAWFLYSLTTLNWVFVKDIMELFPQTSTNGKAASREVAGSIIASKVLHGVLFIALPFAILDLPFYQIAIASVVAHMAAGVTLSVVFQLAHLVDGPTMPAVPETGSMGEGFAAHQLRTTANFSRGSFFAQFICGGLNHQVEHHLFPRICHIHYPAIAPIVMETAKEYGLPYNENPSFLGAVVQHYKLLYRMGHERGRAHGEAPVLG
jgi:linoleoyl-CoA desaturase